MCVYSTVCEYMCICVCVLAINPVLLLGGGDALGLYFPLMRSWQLRFIPLHLFLNFPPSLRSVPAPSRLLHFSSTTLIAHPLDGSVHFLSITLVWFIPSSLHPPFLDSHPKILQIQINLLPSFLAHTFSICSYCSLSTLGCTFKFSHSFTFTLYLFISSWPSSFSSS